ncbi:acyltransferase family protein [Nocardiopsis sediminis]|uniref:Acyltransferase family protein n=1 Tax=Nocardiopsis sediminis TaxID=1778267 RepID=A0ABV8FX99_9ACTN
MTATAVPESAGAQPVPRPAVPEPRRTREPGPARDRFLDALRLLVIVLVVLQHWTLPVLSYSASSGEVTAGTVISTDGGFALTWIAQVMPLIFFVGGAANLLSHRSAAAKGTSTSEWLAKRLRRLAWPVLPLAGTWMAASSLLIAAGVPEQPVRIGAEAAGIVLWFLAVYVLVVVATPVLARADARFGWYATAALFAAAAAVDAVRFGTGAEWAGYLNVALVWPAVHQLGFRYAAGAIGRLPAVLLAAGGFAAAAALAALGPYSPNMTGVFAIEASNVAPPTLVLAAVGAGQIGVAVLLRGPITAWTSRPGPARVLDWATPRLMAVYLWHMVPLAAVAAALVLVLGLATPAPLTAPWLVWCALGAIVLIPMLWPVLWWMPRFDEPPKALRGDPGMVRVLASGALTGGGLLVLTENGLDPGFVPLAGALAVAAGLLLTRRHPGDRPRRGGPRVVQAPFRASGISRWAVHVAVTVSAGARRLTTAAASGGLLR